MSLSSRPSHRSATPRRCRMLDSSESAVYHTAPRRFVIRRRFAFHSAGSYFIAPKKRRRCHSEPAAFSRRVRNLLFEATAQFTFSQCHSTNRPPKRVIPTGASRRFFPNFARRSCRLAQRRDLSSIDRVSLHPPAVSSAGYFGASPMHFSLKPHQIQPFPLTKSPLSFLHVSLLPLYAYATVLK